MAKPQKGGAKLMDEAAERAKSLDEAFERDAEQVQTLLCMDPTNHTLADRTLIIQHARDERARWNVKQRVKEERKEAREAKKENEK